MTHMSWPSTSTVCKTDILNETYSINLEHTRLYVSCNYSLVSIDFSDISTENLLIVYNYITVCIKW